MLEELTVKNYALIDQITVRFEPGFNVLSGETGAGKSILIDALAFVLGSKGYTEGIRQGVEEAEVSAIILAESSPEILEWLGKYGMNMEDDTLVIRRTLRRNGRGNTSVQSVTVTRAALVELTELIFDIHGQHEQQSLFRVSNHRMLLDRFAGIESRVKTFTGLFHSLAETGRKLAALKEEQIRLTKEEDFLRFAVNEIESANLNDDDEEQTLCERQNILARYHDFEEHLGNLLAAGSSSSSGAVSSLQTMKNELQEMLDIDRNLENLSARLENALFEVEDIIQDLRQKYDNSQYDNEELQSVEARLAQINILEKKYSASSIAALKSYEQESRMRLKTLETGQDECDNLEGGGKTLESRVIKEAGEISLLRRKHVDTLQKKTELHLRSLGMSDARFVVDLERATSDGERIRISPWGKDSIEFLLSANKGEKAKPLKSVASGGELSRVMLALKSVLVESDNVQTLIFDEVDTGIGGEVARSVGEHLQELSKHKQVFCVTHLASIAALADNHLLVEKSTGSERTIIKIKAIDSQDRLREVSRMLAGNKENQSSLDHAAVLLRDSS